MSICTLKRIQIYDIYVLNNNVGDTLIDNTKQFNDDHKIIFEEMNQVDIDAKINEKISKDNIIAKMRNDYGINTIRNDQKES